MVEAHPNKTKTHPPAPPLQLCPAPLFGPQLPRRLIVPPQHLLALIAILMVTEFKLKDADKLVLLQRVAKLLANRSRNVLPIVLELDLRQRAVVPPNQSAQTLHPLVSDGIALNVEAPDIAQIAATQRRADRRQKGVAEPAIT